MIANVERIVSLHPSGFDPVPTIRGNMQAAPPNPASFPLRRGTAAIIMRGDRYLVIRRSANVLAPLQYCFPGGGIEGAESESEAIIRELREELGVEIQPRYKVWHNLTRWNVDLAWWMADLGADITPVANPAEVESVHWITADEMLALEELLESNRDFLEALAAGEISLVKPFVSA